MNEILNDMATRSRLISMINDAKAHYTHDILEADAARTASMPKESEYIADLLLSNSVAVPPCNYQDRLWFILTQGDSGYALQRGYVKGFRLYEHQQVVVIVWYDGYRQQEATVSFEDFGRLCADSLDDAVLKLRDVMIEDLREKEDY